MFAPRSVWLQRRLPAMVVFGAAVGYLLLAVFFSLRRHDAYLSGFDLANFDQDLWLIANGHEPMSTQYGQLVWGGHFSPTTALLSVLYVAGVGGPGTLLVIQSATMASVAPLLYFLARTCGAWPWLAVLPGVLWLVSPITLAANLVDVHHVPLVAPLIAGSVLALRKDRLLTFALLALLACLGKEDVPLIYVMLGVVVALEGRRRLGGAIAAASLSLFMFVILVALPALGDSGAYFAGLFAGDRGDTIWDATVWMLTHPGGAVQDLATAENAGILIALVVSTGGLCLLAPRWMLLGLPAVAHNLLSAYEPQHELGTHYYVPAALGFAIAGAVGIERISRLRFVARGLVAAAIATCLVAFTVVIGAAKLGSEWDASSIAVGGGPEVRRQALALVPDDVPVAATARLSVRLSQRPEIYALPLPFDGAREMGTSWSRDEMARRVAGVEWVAMDEVDVPIHYERLAARVTPILLRLGFREVYRRGSVIVFRRDVADDG
jgi:uncharacterized membrane protein